VSPHGLESGWFDLYSVHAAGHQGVDAAAGGSVLGQCAVARGRVAVSVVVVILEVEGDPFGGPVAMRLGVGGSWSTVERTPLG
jgi:hypothetical protein